LLRGGPEQCVEG